MILVSDKNLNWTSSLKFRFLTSTCSNSDAAPFLTVLLTREKRPRSEVPMNFCNSSKHQFASTFYTLILNIQAQGGPEHTSACTVAPV